jgi:hypothetical protein
MEFLYLGSVEKQKSVAGAIEKDHGARLLLNRLTQLCRILNSLLTDSSNSSEMRQRLEEKYGQMASQCRPVLTEAQ